MSVRFSQRSVVLGAGLVCVAAVWAGAWPAGPEPDAAAVLEGLQGWLDGTRDLEGRFEQSLVSGALGAGLAERGRVYLLRPGRMRWDYVDPERKVALVEDLRTRLYVEADRQLWEGTLDETEAVLPLLLSSEQRLGELFEIALLADPAAGDGGVHRLRLAPRGGSGGFEEVVLTLRPPRYAVEQAEVLDRAGNRVVYRFEALKRNRGLPAATFYFEPPPGTEILARH
jgi:outer membrane lipoprotein carrier protein